MSKNASGIYEADLRMVGVGRWHGSLATRKKAEAEPRYAAVRRLFREAKGPNGHERRDLIADLRAGVLTIERLESMVATGEPLVRSEASGAVVTTVDQEVARYLDWTERNPKRRGATFRHARSACWAFANFSYVAPDRVGLGLRIGLHNRDAVTSDMVDTYQRYLVDAGYATNTVTGYMARVIALWNWMQRRETRSAVQERRVPATIHSPVDPETTSRHWTARDRWLTKDEAAALMTVTPPRLQFVVAAGILGGLRIGEILHLRPHVDVDLTLGTITITEKQVGISPDGTPRVWKPKTKRSARVVPIGPDLRPVLENHLVRFASDAWVLPAIEDPSRPFDYGTFLLHFGACVRNAGLIAGRRDPRGVVFHTLRHTFASWLAMSGIDLYTIAQLLGDTVAVVEATYAHLSPDFKKRAIEALKGALVIPSPGKENS